MKDTKTFRNILKFIFFVIVTFAFKFSYCQTNNAYQNNQVIVDSILVGGNYQYIFAIYSGDINQDGSIDASDFLELDPSIQNGDGGYLVGDLNGDGAVDATDFLVLDPNIQNGVGAASPPL